MGYLRARPSRARRRRLRRQRQVPTVRRFFGFGSAQSFSITGSGGLELAGTANQSASVYGPGAAGRSVAPGPSRRVG